MSSGGQKPNTTSVSASSLEARIKAEYSAVRAWIALHPYWSVLIVGVVCAAAGHFL